MSSQDATSPGPSATPLQPPQATALFAFLHAKFKPFTLNDALAVVERVKPDSNEDPKVLAKRLRAALHEQGFVLKHTHALHAAARMLANTSWHDIEYPERLRVASPIPLPKESFAGWNEIGAFLPTLCNAWLKERPSPMLGVRLESHYLGVFAPTAEGGSTMGESVVMITPVQLGGSWLQGAEVALERLRRYLEEPGKAILDGVEAVRIAASRGKVRMAEYHLGLGVDLADAGNAELVVRRVDNPLMPHKGYEIARGTEFTCWSQVQLALKGDSGTDTTVIEGVDEEDGHWIAGDGRYAWELVVAKPTLSPPGLVTSGLNHKDSSRLLRRYRLAQRIANKALATPRFPEPVEWLGQPPETCYVNLSRVRRLLTERGMTWEGFCEAEGTSQPMVPEIPLGFVMHLAERLAPDDPGSILAGPPRDRLARIDNDDYLRVLLPRVDQVRYRIAGSLDGSAREAVGKAVDDFADSLRVFSLVRAGALKQENPLPYLVYASDADELRRALANLGLVAYAGVMPMLVPTKGVIEPVAGAWPFAIGRALFFDIDRWGSARTAQAAAGEGEQ